MEGKLFVNLGDILIRIHNGTMGYFYINLGGYFISCFIMA